MTKLIAAVVGALTLAGCAMATSTGTVRRPGGVPWLPAKRVQIGICYYRQPELPERRVAHDSREELPGECVKHYPEIAFNCAHTGGVSEGGRQAITCTGEAAPFIRGER